MFCLSVPIEPYEQNHKVPIWAKTWKNQQNECAPSKDSDQPGHPPSLIRVFAVRMKKVSTLSYLLTAQQRLWSDWADSQANLSLRWTHSHFVGFVISWLIWWLCYVLRKYVFCQDYDYKSCTIRKNFICMEFIDLLVSAGVLPDSKKHGCPITLTE